MIVQTRNDDCKTDRDEALFLDGAIACARDAVGDAVKVADEAAHRLAQARHRLHTFLTLRNKLPPFRQDMKACAICRIAFKPGEPHAGIGLEHGNGGFYGYDPIHVPCGENAERDDFLARAGTGPEGVKLYKVVDDAIGIGRYE